MSLIIMIVDLFNKLLTNINKNIMYTLVLLVEERDTSYIYMKYKIYYKEYKNYHSYI